jgi:hypothetical protein
MDYMIEEFDPYIFALHQNGMWLRIHASWYDGSELANAKLEAAISSRKNRELKFHRWLEKFHLVFLGTGPNVSKYVPSLQVVDPPQVKYLRKWLEIDGVKGDWENNRAGCKAWKLQFDELHEDVYTLLGAHGLTLLCEEHLKEYLLEHFQIIPSDNVNLGGLRELLRIDSIRLMPSEYEASDDYTTVEFCDETGQLIKFSFNDKQAKVVSILANSKYPVLDRDLLDSLSDEQSVGARLRDLFKTGSGKNAWNSFIVPDAETKPARRKLAGRRKIPR